MKLFLLTTLLSCLSVSSVAQDTHKVRVKLTLGLLRLAGNILEDSNQEGLGDLGYPSFRRRIALELAYHGFGGHEGICDTLELPDHRVPNETETVRAVQAAATMVNLPAPVLLSHSGLHLLASVLSASTEEERLMRARNYILYRWRNTPGMRQPPRNVGDSDLQYFVMTMLERFQNEEWAGADDPLHRLDIPRPASQRAIFQRLVENRCGTFLQLSSTPHRN